MSSPSSKEGVALLVHTSVPPTAPAMKIHVPGRLISVQLPLPSDPLLPEVHVCSFYGPNSSKERPRCEKALAPLLQTCSKILGDYNAVTLHTDTTAVQPNLWPWLIARERSGAIVDLVRPQCTSTPYTWVRRYGGTKSYLDRAYGSRLVTSLFRVSGAAAPDFSSVHGIQDQNPVLVHTQPWPQHRQPEPRCALWDRRDICHDKKKVADLTENIPYPRDASSVEATYAALSACMLEAMHDTNSKKKELPKKDIDVTDWSNVVRQLAKQAKRRSKVFYRRVKHTLLTPPSPSTLPNPTRKIQRILQRNNPWYARALAYIPNSPRLCDPDPPTVEELRSLARAPRRKAPCPNGVPPFLLASLPDQVFSVVHQCVCLCYLEGTLPTPWPISETFCLFKGKGQWQDPDRWRPTAMSNSIYRLLMRWVYKSLYPLLSPLIHRKQFGGKQGVSTAHATHTFLNTWMP